MKKPLSPVLYTCGYEATDVQSFIKRLRQADVSRVVDVRELPLSRKRGFSKRSFAEHLAAAGIDYEHVASLGCPRGIRNSYRADGDWKQYVKAFKRYLSGETEAVAALRAKAMKEAVCLVCFEADYRFCHRSIVSDAVVQGAKLSVEHIIMETDFAEKAPVA